MTDIIRIEKYPEWCKDDIDKIIHEAFINSKKELTFTQLKNIIYSSVFKKMASESLIERLNKLSKMNILENLPKETQIEIWRLKQKEESK